MISPPRVPTPLLHQEQISQDQERSGSVMGAQGCKRQMVLKVGHSGPHCRRLESGAALALGIEALGNGLFQSSPPELGVRLQDRLD